MKTPTIPREQNPYFLTGSGKKKTWLFFRRVGSHGTAFKIPEILPSKMMPRAVDGGYFGSLGTGEHPASQEAGKRFKEGFWRLGLVRANFAPDCGIQQLRSGKWCELFLRML